MYINASICIDYLCKYVQETGGSYGSLWRGELGSWEAGRSTSYCPSYLEIQISYHTHILPLQKHFIPGGKFSWKVLKYPFHLVYSPSPSLEGPGIMWWNLGIGSSIDPAFWVLLLGCKLGTIPLAVLGTVSGIFRDIVFLKFIWLIILPLPLNYS